MDRSIAEGLLGESKHNYYRMIITAGDKSRFAIESGITQAYERLSFIALGYFVIFVGGQRYGVHAPDATLLACSLDEVADRIARRGMHNAHFATDPDAGAIADAYRDALYAPDKENELFFGLRQSEFRHLVYANHITWAPDGDEAFDDWSFVLHFDIKDRVRLIAFRTNDEGYHHDPTTLKDIWLETDEFYGILQQWRDAFKEAWAVTPKISKADDGAERR